MTDDFFSEAGKSINGFVRWISGVPTATPQRQPQQAQQQAIQPKAPCTTCGQQIQAQQAIPIQSVNPNPTETNPNVNNGVQFNGGPSIVRRRNQEQPTNDNYINNGIRFS